jgi:hypothetical protein
MKKPLLLGLSSLAAILGFGVGPAPLSASTIVQMNPPAASVGATVALSGSDFSLDPQANIVYFGAARATVSSATASSLLVTVPIGATYSPVSVTVGGLSAFSSHPFDITFRSTRVIDTSSFAAKVDFAAGKEATSVALGDLDGDGKVDVALSIESKIAVYRNTSSGGPINSSSFALPVLFDHRGGVISSTFAIDFDGDGKLDLACAKEGGYSIAIYKNTSVPGVIGPSSFVHQGDYSAPFLQKGAAGDFDGDGKVDLVVAGGDADIVHVFRNTSSSSQISFALAQTLPAGTYATSAAVADIDGDGKRDLAVTVNSGFVFLFRNTSSPGTIVLTQVASLPTDSPSNTDGFADIDGDGKLDLILSSRSEATIAVFHNRSTFGNFSFAPKVSFPAGEFAIGFAVGDLDGDGKPDVAVANWNQDSLSVLKNTATAGVISSSSFAPRIQFAAVGGGYAVAIGDLNGDSKPELIVPSGHGLAFSVLQNTMAVPPNSPPAGGDNAVTTNEDAPYVFAVADFRFSDSNDNPPNNFKGVMITAPPGRGALKLNDETQLLAGAFVNVVDIQAGRLRFEPASNGNGSPYTSFTFQVEDDGGISNGGVNLDPTPNTMTINVTPINDRPVLSGLSPSASFQENVVNAAPQMIDSDDTLEDPDNTRFTGGNVTVSYAAGGNSQDQLSIRNQGTGSGQIGFSSGTVTYAETVIGTVPTSGAGSGIGGQSLIVTLNENAIIAATEALIENLTYANTSDNPAATRTISVTVNDGNGGTSAAQMVEITVISENDAPRQNLVLLDRFGTYGSFFSFTLPADTFIDLDTGQSVTYCAENLPPGITFDCEKRTFSGTFKAAGFSSTRIIATDNGAPRLSGYGSLTFQISKALLTATADDKSRSYGAANPPLTIHYSGFVNGDTLAVIDAPPSASTTATATSPVGQYVITLSGGSDNNYELTLIPGTLTVTRTALTVKADDKTRRYGEPNPVFTAMITGFVNDENASVVSGAAAFTTSATASSPVESYPITPSLGTLSAANYAFLNFVDGTLSVTQANLLIRADSKSKIYGDALPPLTATYAGFVNGDTPTNLDIPVTLATTATASSSFGDYPITVRDASGANYAIIFQDGTLSVTKAVLTVAADNKDRTYGTANPTLTVTITGFQNGETLATSGITGNPSLSTAATAASSVAGSPYAILASQGTLDALNYSFAFVHGDLTVTRAPLTVQADYASKFYYSENPAFSATITGFVNNEPLTVVSGTPAFSTPATAVSPMGDYPITPSLGTLSAANYVFSQFDNGTLTIVTDPPPVVDAGPDQSKVAGDETTFNGGFTDSGTVGGVYAYEWDFGDGRKESGTTTTVLATLTTTHIYAQAGTYTVRLTVRDDHSAPQSDEAIISVVSSTSVAHEAIDLLTPFVGESKKIEKALQDLQQALAPNRWLDQMHLQPATGKHTFSLLQSALKDLDQVLKDGQKGKVSAAAGQAALEAIQKLLQVAQLISETLYLENEDLAAVNPANQALVDNELSLALGDLNQGEANAAAGICSTAMKNFADSWDHTQRAIALAAQP